MIQPQPNSVYAIRLCSGECRYWKYLGLSGGDRHWWQDMSTDAVFNEDRIMYEWEIIAISDQEKFMN